MDPKKIKETTITNIAAQGTPGTALHTARNAVDAESRTTLKWYASPMWWQHQDQHSGKMIHDMGQEDHLHVSEPDEQDRSFDVVRVKKIY